jgi:hypothetical protein
MAVRQEQSAPLAEAKANWICALEALVRVDKRPPEHGRAAQAESYAHRAYLLRAVSGAEGIWREQEMQARNALATYLAYEAQAGRGSLAERTRCEEACNVAMAELRFLVGGGMDPLATVQMVQELLVQPIIDGKKLLPPMA